MKVSHHPQKQHVISQPQFSTKTSARGPQSFRVYAVVDDGETLARSEVLFAHYAQYFFAHNDTRGEAWEHKAQRQVVLRARIDSMQGQHTFDSAAPRREIEMQCFDRLMAMHDVYLSLNDDLAKPSGET